jgi:hypothetical protein
MGHVSILEAHDRVAHRAKQRLDHDVAAQSKACIASS